ncbi:hypothetical protein J7F01_41040 [Streptomyces sp. ISL-22]|uniref:hypothetical protein n=1 Tax=unclassified Streptomyces TaxID=2593676 RepID=UPI001BEAFF37|nr:MULTISPECIES: hypothetical protein [unclassified Streptomyces]MBT2418369.1 hypothetical protein [Streptomyces sp. ISL-24]MBT2438378.1 hypothetical protein [Streptomyces sp. ISL-22]
MATAEAAKGRGRVTVFSMFGPVFGYASAFVDGRTVAYVGPVTPCVHWRRLWVMADRCNRETATEAEKATWIVSQANRSLICGSDVVVKLSAGDWEVEAGGWQVDLGTWCGQNVLVTGTLSVPALSAEQMAPKPTRFPQYAN